MFGSLHFNSQYADCQDARRAKTVRTANDLSGAARGIVGKSLAQLVPPGSRIPAAQVEQLSMCAGLDDVPGIHDVDNVGLHGGRKTMGDDQDGPAVNQLAEA